MPYQWLPSPSDDAPPRLRLRPHGSLSAPGFVWFIGATALLIALPALTVLGSKVLWGLLPFLLGAVAAIWLALRKNQRDRAVIEELEFQPTRLHLIRKGPGRRVQEWQANPHWVRVTRHVSGGPVPDYLTLAGGGREVEIGAFLTPEERRHLEDELNRRLWQMKFPP